MVTQVALPNEVVLVIVELLDIDTFLGIRLTCRSYNNLIDSHMSSLTLAVAHNTFPTQKRSFEPNQEDGGRRSTLRWLKWLRYEQLAAMLVERSSPVPISAEDPSGDELRHGVAHGWNIIAHLGRIIEQASSLALNDLTTIFQPGRTSTPSEPPLKPDMVEKEARGLDICFRILRFVQSWTLNELKGYQFITRALILDVFGPHHNRASSSADLCRWDCVTWLITRIIQLGPQRFWHQWRKYGTGDLAYEIGAAWKLADRPLSRWELDGPRLIEHQINFILIQVKSVVAESYSTRLERRLGLLCFQPGYFGGLCLGMKRTPNEKPQIPFVFGSLPISQPLNWQFLAESGEHPLQISSEERHQRRQGTFERPKEERTQYTISREAMALYTEWWQEWLNTCSVD